MTLKGIFPVIAMLGASLVTSGEGTRTPVLVELFTSEGCSSCPPADSLLMRLDATQPVPGAEIIILSQHVDYWNHLGWADPFSSKDFTIRQQNYAASFHTDGPYTPQMVVDGRAQFTGSDARQASRAIAEAARSPKAAVTVTPTAAPDGKVRLQIHVAELAEKADVFLAISESGLQSSVLRGENTGRNMAHSGVVRQLKVIGSAGKEGFSGEQTIALDKKWKRENVRVVVFAQERASKHVAGSAMVALPTL